MSDQSISYIACGPSNATCKCECGAPGGKCEHKWDGEGETFDDGRGWSATCSRCGMLAISHDVRVGP